MLRRHSTVVMELCRECILCSSHLQVACSGLQLDKQLWPPAGLRIINMGHLFALLLLVQVYCMRLMCCDMGQHVRSILERCPCIHGYLIEHTWYCLRGVGKEGCQQIAPAPWLLSMHLQCALLSGLLLRLQRFQSSPVTPCKARQLVKRLRCRCNVGESQPDLLCSSMDQ